MCCCVAPDDSDDDSDQLTIAFSAESSAYRYEMALVSGAVLYREFIEVQSS